MAKAKKGISFSMILLLIGIVVQIATISVVFLFLKDSKEAQLFEAIKEAEQSAEWAIPFEELAESEKSTLKQFILNAEQTLRSYWHSEDRDFRVTLQSKGLKELMFNHVLVVKEGTVGNHLVLTIYYNPLLQKNPKSEDLVPVYQIVRYEKPELAKLYEEQEQQKDKNPSKFNFFGGKKDSEEEDVESSEVEEASVSTNTLERGKEDEIDVLTIKKEDLHYPFEESRILKDSEDYIVYESIGWGDLENVLNQEFLMKYIDETSFKGDYGWESGVFLQEEAE